MQKWQHHLEMITPWTQKDDPNGRSEVYKKVRDLGEKGWEMVGLTVVRGDLWAAFKRPVEDDDDGDQVRAAAQAARQAVRGSVPR